MTTQSQRWGSKDTESSLSLAFPVVIFIPHKTPLKPTGTWSCLANELDLSQHWHPPKCWEESEEWNCRTLATMRHLSWEITLKPRKCQAAHGSRLPVNRRCPGGTNKNSGLGSMRDKPWEWGVRLLQREACLPDLGGFFWGTMMFGWE